MVGCMFSVIQSDQQEVHKWYDLLNMFCDFLRIL
jgi:hypothetical protein